MDLMADDILSYFYDLEQAQEGHENTFPAELREGFKAHPKSLHDFPQTFQESVWDMIVKHTVPLGITPNRLQNRSMQSIITV